MMAFGDDGMTEPLLDEAAEEQRRVKAPSPASSPMAARSSAFNGRHAGGKQGADQFDFEFISERETLVFEDDELYRGRGGKGDNFFMTYLMSKIQPGSVKGSMFTMTVAIVGAGILALPYAVHKAGLVLGMLLIILGAAAANFSLRLLITCSELGQARSYMDLSSATGGRRLAAFTQSVVCMNLFGTCVGYLVGSAELIQLGMRTFLGSDSRSVLVDRQALLLTLTLVFVLPLSLFRSLESLRFSSLFSIVCIVFMTLVIVIKYFQFVHQGLAPTIAYQFTHLALFDWKLAHLLESIPLVVFAFTCHPNVLPIYLVLKRRSSRRMYKVMNRSVGLATTVYCLCSLVVVLTFGDATLSNFLKNDYHGDGAVVAGCLGFSVALILTVPLFVHTLRDNLREALLANRRLHAGTHALLSMLLVLAVVLVALAAGDIASVLAVLGATTNPVICFVLPAFFVVRLAGKSSQHAAQKFVAVLLALVVSTASALSLLHQLHVLQ